MKADINCAQKLLKSRLEDHLRQAERGELVCGNFLSCAEAAYCLSVAITLRARDRIFLWGGFDDAERKRLFVLPSFVSDMDGTPEDKSRCLFSDEMSVAIKALKIKGSGYRPLGHRDYLGTVLSLGVERHAVGDIVILNDFEAIIFCTDKILDFLLSNIDRVASDKVSVSEFIPDDSFCVKRDFQQIRDTVASNRFDCVVGALTNVSREKAQELIKSERCEIDHCLETKCAATVTAPCVISIRGHGRFDVLSFDGETRRGRLRLSAQKYI